MRIDAFNKVSQIYQATKPKKTAQAESTQSFSDVLELSQTGKDMQVAKSAVSSSADVRADKIADIKARMENGTYNVSAHDVAAKLIDG